MLAAIYSKLTSYLQQILEEVKRPLGDRSVFDWQQPADFSSGFWRRRQTDLHADRNYFWHIGMNQNKAFLYRRFKFDLPPPIHIFISLHNGVFLSAQKGIEGQFERLGGISKVVAAAAWFAKPHTSHQPLPRFFFVELEVNDVRNNLTLAFQNLHVHHGEVVSDRVDEVEQGYPVLQAKYRNAAQNYDEDCDDGPKFAQGFLLSLNRVQGDGGAVEPPTVPHTSNPNTLTVEGQRRGEAT